MAESLHRYIVGRGGNGIDGAWNIVEPHTTFIDGWHLHAMAEHLEAVSRGQIRNLIINVPPRHAKSLVVSVFWMTWEWANNPWKQWIFSSYSDHLSIRDSIKCRRIFASDWFQYHFGNIFRIVPDQDTKKKFENDHGGHRLATGVGGLATGEGAHIVCGDDLLKAKDAYSDTVRDAANDFWTKTLATRGNDPKTFAKVMIAQRLHEGDTPGHLVAEMLQGTGERYEVLVLPAEYEPNRSILTWKTWHGKATPDPRQKPGQLLWPERYTRLELEALKLTLGTDAPGQLQQRPEAAEGSIFKKAWWAGGRNRYLYNDGDRYWQIASRWQFWDTALKDEEQNDYTALFEVEVMADYHLEVRRVGRWKIESYQLPELIQKEAQRANVDGRLSGIVIEDKASGTTAIQTLRATAPEWIKEILIDFIPQGSKTFRARQAAMWCARDLIKFPFPCEDVAEWHDDLLDENKGNLFKFPAVIHDDEIDAFDMGIIYLENYLEIALHAQLETLEKADGANWLKELEARYA
jgi:phage terminase large subunit-like protein